MENKLQNLKLLKPNHPQELAEAQSHQMTEVY